MKSNDPTGTPPARQRPAIVMPSHVCGRGTLKEAHRCGMVREVCDALWARLDGACDGIRHLAPRETLSQAGDRLTHSALLLDGIMARYIAEPGRDRNNRLMVSIQVPGDFVDLHALPLRYLDHDVAALADCKIALFPHDALTGIMEQDAEHARMLWRLTMLDAAIHRHWIYRAGRLRALAAVADFICEMDLRLQACGKVRDNRVPLPMTSADLAEVSGLSTMHVGRVLRDLREANLCTIGDGVALIHDREGLRQLAGFDPSYMYQLAGQAEPTPPRG